jgi:undecaprenyl diphosphate synthase
MPDRAIAELPFPRHVGIIMDGNGRWAQERGLPRSAGHRAGARTVRLITEHAARLGVRQLTLYAFSSENWSRPEGEVRLLMRLFARYLRSERRRLLRNDIRLRVIGRTAELPPEVREELAESVEATRHGARMTLCLAINYGGRNEIVDACRVLAARAAAGEIEPEGINADAIAANLYQPDMPPLDLIIRTAGEMRLSNFLLWQAAYAELWVTEVPWPQFDAQRLDEALRCFQRRERRFGGLPGSAPGAERRLQIAE